MIFHKTKLEGVYVIEPELKMDERGYFARIFSIEDFKTAGISFNIVCANLSFNTKAGTIRGMHFQKEPKAEDKIVQCLRGAIYDVVVDLRPDSPNYGEWLAEELNEKNGKMFLVSKGFAHGFQTLADGSLIQYFMSKVYSPDHSSGVRWDDSKLGINWPLPPTAISKKDKNWPLL